MAKYKLRIRIAELIYLAYSGFEESDLLFRRKYVGMMKNNVFFFLIEFSQIGSRSKWQRVCPAAAVAHLLAHTCLSPDYPWRDPAHEKPGRDVFRKSHDTDVTKSAVGQQMHCQKQVT